MRKRGAYVHTQCTCYIQDFQDVQLCTSYNCYIMNSAVREGKLASRKFEDAP